MELPSIHLNRIFFDFLLALFAAVGSSLFLKKSPCNLPDCEALFTVTIVFGV